MNADTYLILPEGSLVLFVDDTRGTRRLALATPFMDWAAAR
jgi:hypothetical protein